VECCRSSPSLGGEVQLLQPVERRALHAFHRRGQNIEPLADLEGRRHNVRDDIAAVPHPPRGEDAGGDDETIGAHDPEKPNPQLIGASPVMGVKEDNLRDGVPQLDGLEPPPQPDQVAGMHRAPGPRRLASFNRLEASQLQGLENAGRRDEGVRGARPLVSARGIDGRDPLLQRFGGQDLLECAAVG